MSISKTIDIPLRLENINIKPQDSSSIDAFGRWRVSNPETLFDSKQIFDNQPLFWDELLESGAGISSSHSVITASTTITSTINTAGQFTRRTFMRFNYQPGKSQMVMMTGILDKSGGGTGVERRIGLFDGYDGLFFEDDAGTIGVTRRTDVSGSPVDNTVTQSNWNIDVMDGTGPSGQTLDFSKLQIFFIDFEWLGAGRVRMGFILSGIIFYVHEFVNANVLDTVFMSNPNLPLTYQMITTGSSPASVLQSNCTTVISEGGTQDNGVLRYKSTEGIEVTAATQDLIYAIVGVRLKSSHINSVVNIINTSLQIQTANDRIEWLLILNPTIAGTFNYSSESNSSIQTAIGITANTNTVTGGLVIAGGYVESQKFGGTGAGSGGRGVDNAIRLGSAINGVLDEIILCARPIGGSTDVGVEGSIEWRELS